MLDTKITWHYFVLGLYRVRLRSGLAWPGKRAKVTTVPTKSLRPLAYFM